jgi:hypothetical protein
MQTSFETAKTYLDYGLSVLPARRKDKCPAVRSWKAYQERLPTQSEVGAWFANAPDAVCIVTGMASGNLEIIDFDNGGELFEPWEKLVKESAKGLFDRLVIEQTPSGGWHAVYRCERAVDGNMKLAQGQRNGKLTTLIETRGHGGLFLCAPTENYELVQGDFSAIPMLSKDQRDILLSSARQLNEHWVSADPAPITKTQSSGLLPGEDFNQCGDVKALLEKYGWKYLYNKNDNDYYRRPGKNSGSCSASLKDRTFFVFSSNAAPFEAWKSYSPFAVFAQLECYGDYSFAAGGYFRYCQSGGTETGIGRTRRSGSPAGASALGARFHQQCDGIHHADRAVSEPDAGLFRSLDFALFSTGPPGARLRRRPLKCVSGGIGQLRRGKGPPPQGEYEYRL